MLDFKKDWDENLPLCEFTYNNNYYSSIGKVPFEALCGRRCRTLVCWEEIVVRSFYGPSKLLILVRMLEFYRCE